MRRDEILKALEEAGTPITIEDLAKRINADVAPLRIDLFRLASEGKVERRRRGNQTLWEIKVASPIEQRYERLTKKYVP